MEQGIKTLIHADVFFFITSIAVVVLALGGIILFIYGFRILKNLDHIVSRLRAESDLIINDVSEVRERIKENGIHFADVLGMIGTLFHIKRFIKKKSKKTKHEETTE